MKKIFSIFTLATILIIALNSCSKTRDGLGLDAINNNARIGKWEVQHLIYATSSTEPVTDPIFEEYAHAEFKSDNNIHFYDKNGVDIRQIPYSFIDTKTIRFGGDEYGIQENLAGSFAKMTLQRATDAGTAKDVYIFKR